MFPLRMRLLESIDSVSDLNDDRILRTVFNLIDSTVRSNYPPTVGIARMITFIAIKINSMGVIDMPACQNPIAKFTSMRFDMEGIHLRGGKIARGGIRWSDRPR